MSSELDERSLISVAVDVASDRVRSCETVGFNDKSICLRLSMLLIGMNKKDSANKIALFSLFKFARFLLFLSSEFRF